MPVGNSRGAPVIYVAGSARELPAEVQDWLSRADTRAVASNHLYDMLAQLALGKKFAAVIINIASVDWNEMEFFDHALRMSREMLVFVAGSHQHRAKLEAACRRGARLFDAISLDEELSQVMGGTSVQQGSRTASPRPEREVATGRGVLPESRRTTSRDEEVPGVAPRPWVRLVDPEELPPIDMEEVESGFLDDDDLPEIRDDRGSDADETDDADETGWNDADSGESMMPSNVADRPDVSADSRRQAAEADRDADHHRGEVMEDGIGVTEDRIDGAERIPDAEHPGTEPAEAANPEPTNAMTTDTEATNTEPANGVVTKTEARSIEATDVEVTEPVEEAASDSGTTVAPSDPQSGQAAPDAESPDSVGPQEHDADRSAVRLAESAFGSNEQAEVDEAPVIFPWSIHPGRPRRTPPSSPPGSPTGPPSSSPLDPPSPPADDFHAAANVHEGSDTREAVYFDADPEPPPESPPSSPPFPQSPSLPPLRSTPPDPSIRDAESPFRSIRLTPEEISALMGPPARRQAPEGQA